MPWKPGQSGNPAGRLSEKLFADALRAVVNMECPKRKRGRLLLIAERLVENAMNGDAWAISMVADRLDGKPAQESTVNVNDGRDRMTDVELRSLIAAAVAGTVSSGNGAAKSDDPQIVH